MMAPVIGQLAGEYEGRVKIGKLNVDENPDIAVRYKVMSVSYTHLSCAAAVAAWDTSFSGISAAVWLLSVRVRYAWPTL